MIALKRHLRIFTVTVTDHQLVGGGTALKHISQARGKNSRLTREPLINGVGNAVGGQSQVSGTHHKLLFINDFIFCRAEKLIGNAVTSVR